MALRDLSLLGCVLLATHCAAPPASPPGPIVEEPSPAASAPVAPDAAAAPPLEADAGAATDSGPQEKSSEERHASPPEVLFDNRGERAEAVGACASEPEEKRTRCLVERRFRGDEQAQALALEMWDRWKTLAGVEPEHDMDGGYRGLLHLVPVVPTGRDRRHLTWVRDSLLDYETFFAKLSAGRSESIRYRHDDIAFRFFRSVKAHTPAAYAWSWTVAYNVEGSLNVTATSVRETLFHEIFHLNDQEHGDWSPTALSEVFDAVVAKCGTKMDCLRPFSPGDTVVRGGTYYAFQPGNGVREYAAELAIRYYREQRAQIGMGAFPRPAFKCGNAGNAKAWKALVNEFFGGIDRTPDCR